MVRQVRFLVSVEEPDAGKATTKSKRARSGEGEEKK